MNLKKKYRYFLIYLFFSMLGLDLGQKLGLG